MEGQARKRPAAAATGRGAENEHSGSTPGHDSAALANQQLGSEVRATVFRDVGGRTADEYPTTWPLLCEWIAGLPAQPSKQHCTLIKLATFGDMRSAKGSLRHNANVTSVYGLEGDYDAGEITPEQARDMLELVGVEALVVTTPSHGTPGKGNRWRVFVPLAEPIAPEQRHALLCKLNALLGGVLTVESFTLSQAFYVGPVQGVEYCVLRAEGVPLDQLPGVDQLPEEGPPAARQRAAVTPDNPLALATKRARGGVEEVRAVLERIPNEGIDWERWNKVGMAVYNATAGSEEGRQAFEDWSTSCPDSAGPGSAAERWEHYHTSPPSDVGMGWLYHEAGGRAAVEPPEPEPVPAERSGLPFAASIETVQVLDCRGARLVRFNGDFLTYVPSAGHYRELEDEAVRAEVRRYRGGWLSPTKVTRAVDELKAATYVDPHDSEPPCWIDPAPGMPEASELIVCRNGIVHPHSGRMFQHTDSLLTYNALPFDYDPSAPTPETWLAFLADLFPSDGEAVRELQKLFGYLLTLDNRLQKIFLLIGPKRSGKGTIGRVLTSLIGRRNAASTTPNKLSGDFGLQPLIGKQLAIMADARVGARTDKAVVNERLLSISGGDPVDVSRKHTTDWSGTLSARFLILSNEIPTLPDPSGALASRYVVFALERSFYGREDHQLDAKLQAELPSILNWSLKGLRALRRDGYIRTPASATDVAEGAERIGSPVKAFIADRCVWGAGYTVPKHALWRGYCDWHVAGGLPGSPLSKEIFGRAVKSAFGLDITDGQVTQPDGSRPTAWKGLRLAEEFQHRVEDSEIFRDPKCKG